MASSGITCAHAADSGVGWYTGVNVGRSSFPSERDESIVGQDNSDTEFTVSAGYRFSRYIGMEASYLDLGEATLSLVNGPAHALFTFGSKGTSFGLIAAWPLGRWEPFLRGGVFFAQTRSTLIGVSDTGEPIDERNDARTGQAYETLGVRFRFTDHWNTSVQLDRTTVGEKDRTGQAVMIGFTLGAQYRF